MRRELSIFLLLQAVAAVVAVMSFRIFETRWQAALVAGSFFTFVGLWMAIRSMRWPHRFKLFSFYLSRIHLVFALTMLLVRMRNPEQDFNLVNFVGIPGPLFHRIAEIVFLLMVAGTAIDWLRARRFEAAPQ